MKLVVVSLVFCFYRALSSTTNPCELVQKLASECKSPGTCMINITDYPIAVCIAGYRHYDFQHEILDVNNTGHYGIFGITDSFNPSKCKAREGFTYVIPKYLMNKDFYVSVDCLANEVLNNRETMRFYEKLCQPHLIRNVLCSTKKGYVAMFDPIHKDLVDRIFRGETDLNDDLILNVDSSRTTPKYSDEREEDSARGSNDTTSVSGKCESSTSLDKVILINLIVLVINLVCILLHFGTSILLNDRRSVAKTNLAEVELF